MSDEKKTNPKGKNSKVFNNVIAHEFCESEYFIKKLVYFIDYDSFFLYTENRYFKKLNEREFNQTLLRYCETQFPSQGVTVPQLKDITALIKLKINRSAPKEDANLIAFKDCLYDTETHNTQVFSVDRLATWNLPYNLADTKKKATIFQSFLETSLVEQSATSVPDFELINLVQEMMGFLMLSNKKAIGAFFLYGAGSNGKSVLSSLIERIVGDEYASALSLAHFNDKFAVKDIINKRVNISNEEDDKFASSKMFKVLITGEAIRGEHKFGDGFKMRATCKFLFSSNRLPTFDGLDEGLKRRIFLIPFYRIFSTKEQDKSLLDKMTAEIPAIIGWALQGAKRLAKNDYVFSESKASSKVFSEFEEEMSGGIMFFNDNYVVDNKSKTDKKLLFVEYVNWCRDNGKKSFSKPRFNRELLDNIVGLRGDLTTSINGVSARVFNCRYSDRDTRDLPKTDVEQITEAFQGEII